jgi:hypothetical protein
MKWSNPEVGVVEGGWEEGGCGRGDIGTGKEMQKMRPRGCNITRVEVSAVEIEGVKVV